MNLERIGCLRFRYSASSEEHWFNAFNVMGFCDSCIVFLNFLPQSLTRQVLQRFACHLVDMFLGNPCAFDAHLKSLLFMALLPPSKLLPPERMAYQEVISHHCPFISPLFNPCFRFLVVLIGVRRAMNYDSASWERKDEVTPKAWPQRRISGWFSQSEAMKMTNRSPRKTHRPLWKWFLSCITQGLNTLNLWQVKRKIYKSLDLQAAVYWQKWTAIHGRNLCKEVVRWIFAAPCTTLAMHFNSRTTLNLCTLIQSDTKEVYLREKASNLLSRLGHGQCRRHALLILLEPFDTSTLRHPMWILKEFEKIIVW